MMRTTVSRSRTQSTVQMGQENRPKARWDEWRRQKWRRQAAWGNAQFSRDYAIHMMGHVWPRGGWERALTVDTSHHIILDCESLPSRLWGAASSLHIDEAA